MGKNIKNLKGNIDTPNKDDIQIIVLSGIVAVTGNMFASALYDLFAPVNESFFVLQTPACFLLIILALSAFSFYFAGRELMKILRAYLTVRRIAQKKDNDPKKALILFVSPIMDKMLYETNTQKVGTVDLRNVLSLKDAIVGLNEVYADNKHWSWQQLLRAIQPHVAVLETVVFVVSNTAKNNDGKIDTVAQARNSLAPLLQRFLKQELTCDSVYEVDPEKFENVQHTLNGIIAELRKRYTNSDIVIDVTGMQKTTSIAAATVTLTNDDLIIQYVKTDGSGDVLPYNLVAYPATKP